MRIFYAVPETPHVRSLPSSRIWHINFFLPLIDLGNELVEFEFDYSSYNLNLDFTDPSQKEWIASNRPRFSEELLSQVKRTHSQKPIDLFFSYFYSAYVDPEAIREIGKMGIPTVNWYCNASYQFHLVEEIAPAFSYCLVPERYRLEDYRRIGATPIYLQEAANPVFYHPYDIQKDFDVTFIGQRYGNRPGNIRSLLDSGVDVYVWGPHWKDPMPDLSLVRKGGRILKRLAGSKIPLSDVVPIDRCGPPLSDQEMVMMYSRSKINLGFTSLAGHTPDNLQDKQVRLRDFEVTMSGGFYLVEHFDELAEFFEPGTEIVTFHNREDLVEKAKYYLGHDTEREQIRQAGLKRAVNEHSWQQRFRSVFHQIGLE